MQEQSVRHKIYSQPQKKKLLAQFTLEEVMSQIELWKSEFIQYKRDLKGLITLPG